MSWSPITVGDGRTSHHAFTTDSGIFSLVGISNTAISMHFETMNDNVITYVCTGTWQITNAAGGLADFFPSQADLTTGPLGQPGLYNVYPVVTLSTGPVSMDPQLIDVVSRP